VGETAGFDDFVASRSTALLRTAFLLTGDHQHAEDLLQTALAAIYVRWDRLRDTRAAEQYVRRTLMTTYTGWWRRRSWSERPTADLPEPMPDASLDVSDDRRELWSQLQGLPRQQRAVVVLRFYEERSVDETAALLGISAGTVKSHTSRALGALRIQMAGDTTAAIRQTNRPPTKVKGSRS